MRGSAFSWGAAPRHAPQEASGGEETGRGAEASAGKWVASLGDQWQSRRDGLGEPHSGSEA